MKACSQSLKVQSKQITICFYRNPKSSSKGPILYRRNETNTSSDVDTRYMPSSLTWSYPNASKSLPLLYMYSCSLDVEPVFHQRIWVGFDSQYLYLCLLFFPPDLPLLPASVGSARDSWQPGMGLCYDCSQQDAWEKGQNTVSPRLTLPWHPYEKKRTSIPVGVGWNYPYQRPLFTFCATMQ